MACSLYAFNTTAIDPNAHKMLKRNCTAGVLDDELLKLFVSLAGWLVIFSSHFASLLVEHTFPSAKCRLNGFLNISSSHMWQKYTHIEKATHWAIIQTVTPENQAKNKHTDTKTRNNARIYGWDTVGNDNFIIFASSYFLRNDPLFFSLTLFHCSTFVTFHISLSIEWQWQSPMDFFASQQRPDWGRKSKRRETEMRCCYGRIGHSPLHYTYINKQAWDDCVCESHVRMQLETTVMAWIESLTLTLSLSLVLSVCS